MQKSKLVSLSDAVDRHIRSGASVAMGLGLETCIPFAVGHEIIRLKKRDLTLIGPISDILFDQLVGAGCVARIRAAWAGNVITGSGYNLRRAIEGGGLEVEDHSNLTIVMGLRAGAMGVPFMPALTALGSDLPKTNKGLREMICPFTGKTLQAVAAIVPDVAVVPVQRCDEYGNAHAWGNLGVSREACLAAEKIIISAEEIVSAERIRSDPNRVLTPGFRVSAVVHRPFGAHPSPMPGHYNRDHDAFLEYRKMSRTVEGYQEWRRRWIDRVASSEDYIERIGTDRIERLGIRHHRFCDPVDYGY